MAKGDDIEERLIAFAIRIVKLCDMLPRTRASNHIANQLLRSGTAPAAHYAEARGAESNRDFIHKLKIALKELNESKVWLRIISQSDLFAKTKMRPIQDECLELCKITNASIRTAKKQTAVSKAPH